LVGLVLLIWIMRRRVPVFSGIFLALDKLQLFAYLSVGLKSGLRLLDLIKNYQGAFAEEMQRIFYRASEEGEELGKVFVEELGKYLSPLEKANLKATFRSRDREELAQAFSLLFDDELLEVEKQFEKISKVVTNLSYAMVGFVIYIVFVNIYLKVFDIISSAKLS